MNDNEEVKVTIEDFITFYIFLYILAYVQMCVKLAEDLELDSEIQAVSLEQYTSPAEIRAEHSVLADLRVYTWPELD